MTSRDLFGVVMRGIGICGLGFALQYLGSGLYDDFMYRSPDYLNANSYFMHAFVFGALSLYLLRGAPLLMSFCYGDDERGG